MLQQLTRSVHNTLLHGQLYLTLCTCLTHVTRRRRPFISCGLTSSSFTRAHAPSSSVLQTYPYHYHYHTTTTPRFFFSSRFMYMFMASSTSSLPFSSGSSSSPSDAKANHNNNNNKKCNWAVVMDEAVNETKHLIALRINAEHTQKIVKLLRKKPGYVLCPLLALCSCVCMFILMNCCGCVCN